MMQAKTCTKGTRHMQQVKRISRRLKRVEIVLMVAAALVLMSGALALQTQDQLADKVVRLHVLANSDSEEDQALKLRVRSADRQEAEALLRGNLLELENLAAEEIAAAGYDYPVTAELTDTTFPTREYDGFTLPAGEYLALRIVIGEGAGQNWWCVVFPPLCTTASADVPASALAAGLTQEDVNLITEEPGYVLKFKTVELWERLRAALEG